MQLKEIISIIFFIACGIYFLYGLQVLSYNTKSTKHWFFFACCLDMSLWALCFSIGNLAPDYESALVSRRIASVGWGTMFSYFLHYILLLTENSVLKKKWIYVLLYVPALLNIFLYGINKNTAVEAYHLVQTNFGWINIAGNSALDWYYYIYYVGFAAIGILLLFRWGRSSKDIKQRKQALLIGASYIVAVILGSFTEYIINFFFHEKVPQLAPVFILLPVSVMLFFISRFNFMQQNAKKAEPKPNQILSDYTKNRLYHYLSITYVLAGFVNFGAQFFAGREQLSSILAFSAVILGLGIAVGVLRKMKIKQDYKQLFSNIAFVISIPIIMIKYTPVSGVYAWAVPVILMLVAIAFNQLKLLYWIGGATFASLIWLWVKAPVSNLTFSAVDHISRLIIMTTILWFVFFINRTYVNIIKANKEKVGLEKLLNQVSNLFLKSNSAQPNNIMTEALELCGNYFKLDCVRVTFLTEKMEPDKDYLWHTSGTEIPECSCELETLLGLIAAVPPDTLSEEGSLFVAEPEEEQGAIGDLFESTGMKSLIMKPLRNKGKTIGILFLGSAKRRLKWRNDTHQTTRLFANVLSDIWMKQQAEEELVNLASRDALTGLPNRIAFYKHVGQEIIKAEQSGNLVGIIFVDIDKFKVVNDSLGHESGDFLLVEIGKALRDCLRPADFLARFGGDEFLVMVPQMDNFDDIRGIVERLMDSFEKPFVVKGQEFHMSPSTGIAVYPHDGTDAETLIINADLAMYKSKERGKNQYTFCSDKLKEETVRRIKLTEDLHSALARQELKLHYQPQVCAISKHIIGVEALLRWDHPELGVVDPCEFIPLAEQTGLIGPIGEWVLTQACLQRSSHHLKGLDDVRVAVNVSIVQLRFPGFVKRVQQIIEETRLDPQCLELEITESMAVSDFVDITEMLETLNKLGISITIDDFGTQYSSLSRLSALPIDRIKLDMQFAQSINRSEKENAMIQGIIRLAHTLGLKVLAEGVETQQQLDFLTENSIDEIQGFYFYKPVPPDEFERVLLRDSFAKKRMMEASRVLVAEPCLKQEPANG